jgi:hypothetical protein
VHIRTLVQNTADGIVKIEFSKTSCTTHQPASLCYTTMYPIVTVAVVGRSNTTDGGIIQTTGPSLVREQIFYIDSSHMK